MNNVKNNGKIAAQAARRGGGDNRYQMVQKMVSIGDDFWIENGRGEKVYKVDGKALRVRSTLTWKIADGQEVLPRFRRSGARARHDGHRRLQRRRPNASLKKAMITPLRSRFVLNIAGRAGHRHPGQHPRSRIHLRARRSQDRGNLQEVVPPARFVRRGNGAGPDNILILAATVAIDMMENPGR